MPARLLLFVIPNEIIAALPMDQAQIQLRTLSYVALCLFIFKL